MNFFLIFALIFFTIIVAIFLQKLVNSPILIGLLFFSVFILISAITGNTNFIIVSVVLGIIAFISAFLFCILQELKILEMLFHIQEHQTIVISKKILKTQ